MTEKRGIRLTHWMLLIFTLLLCVVKVIISYNESYKLEKQMIVGNFSNTQESDLVNKEELEDVYNNMLQDINWIHIDLNRDGIKDLVWMEHATDTERIVGIFDMKDKGKCVYWDIMDQTEFFFIANNYSLVRYSQYFGFYDYVSYEQYVYDEKWNMSIVEGAYAYNIYELEIPYWLDEHNHDDMKQIGTYFKQFANGIETSITKSDFVLLYENVTGDEYQSIQKRSDLFWLH